MFQEFRLRVVELKTDIRQLRRMQEANAQSMRESVLDAHAKIKVSNCEKRDTSCDACGGGDGGDRLASGTYVYHILPEYGPTFLS